MFRIKGSDRLCKVVAYLHSRSLPLNAKNGIWIIRLAKLNVYTTLPYMYYSKEKRCVSFYALPNLNGILSRPYFFFFPRLSSLFTLGKQNVWKQNMFKNKNEWKQMKTKMKKKMKRCQFKNSFCLNTCKLFIWKHLVNSQNWN